jgi:hypothetical protein
MATNASPFVVNIVELQNIATSITGAAGGSAGLSQVQQDVANIQQMVNYDTKTIAADVLSNFTNSFDIQVLANLNLSNSVIYSNSNLVSFGTSAETTSSLNASISSISFNIAGATPLELTSTGNLQFTSSATYFSTGVNIAGWLYVSESAFVKNLYQTSDKNKKTRVEPFFTTVNDVLKLESRQFSWKSSGEPDIGFIAQEVQEVWPQLVETDPNGSLGLAYSRFIPLLLESIRELNTRLTKLENKA